MKLSSALALLLAASSVGGALAASSSAAVEEEGAVGSDNAAAAAAAAAAEAGGGTTAAEASAKGDAECSASSSAAKSAEGAGSGAAAAESGKADGMVEGEAGDKDAVVGDDEADGEDVDEDEDSEDDDDDDDEEEDSEDSEDEEEDYEYEWDEDAGEDQWHFPENSLLADYVEDYFEHMKEYLRTLGDDDPELAPLVNRCKNQHELCMQWAALGMCEKDPLFMQQECAPACRSCHMLLYERRCPYDPASPQAWGDKIGSDPSLNRMFERIVSDAGLKKYRPKIWSRPSAAEVDDEHDRPWVVSLENFLTDSEVSRIIQLGDEDGFERSDDGGEYLPDGTFKTYHIDGRTSYNAWCRTCHGDDLGGRDVIDKIEEVTHIARDHFANLQILRYTKTQHYHLHHDYDYYSTPRQPGPRVLTFFLYLSDVEEGGGTSFPHLNLTFAPRKGRALIWPNVLDGDPTEMDERTEHVALPVVKGTKYAANAWIHLHDWQGPAERECDE